MSNGISAGLMCDITSLFINLIVQTKFLVNNAVCKLNYALIILEIANLR